jgi:hypothetical protein
MVYLFALAHFGEWRGRRAGRPQEWTNERYAQLQRDFDSIRKEKPAISSIEVCRRIKKRYPERYKKQSPARLDKEVKNAYDPRFNPQIGAFMGLMLKAFEEAHLKRGLAWGPDVEAATLKEMLKFLQERKFRKHAAATRTSSNSIEK